MKPPYRREPVPAEVDVRGITLGELAALIVDTIGEMEADIAVLEERSVAAATADRGYRQNRATAYLATSGTVGERESSVEQLTADLRHAAKLAEDLKVAALEAVRCRRAKLSALQTLANAMRAEIQDLAPHQ